LTASRPGSPRDRSHPRASHDSPPWPPEQRFRQRYPAGYEPLAGTILGGSAAVTQPVTFSLLRKSRHARGFARVRTLGVSLPNTSGLKGGFRPFLPTEPASTAGHLGTACRRPPTALIAAPLSGSGPR
jgi:hypothetical protein